MAFRISRGLWQFAKADGTYETKYKINTSGQIVQTDTAGNEVAGLAASSVAWTSVTGKPTTFSPSTHSHAWSEITSKPTIPTNTNQLTNGSGFLANGDSYIISYVYRIHASDGTSPDNFGYNNRYQTFNYGVSSGVSGPLITFGGLGDNYPMQITGAYNVDGLFKARVRNGDNGAWHPWRTFITDGNISSQSVNYATSAGAVAWTAVTGKPSTFAPSSHSHAWSEITGKPTTFAPSAHTHAISDVTGLQGALDGKQAAGSYLTSLPAHTHDDRYYTESESDSKFAEVNNSSYFLDGGGTTSGYFEGNIPGITSYYDGLTINMFARNAFASYNYVNINGLGNAQIFLYSTSRLTTHYPRYSTIKLVYKSDFNGGCWFTEMYYYDTGDYRIRWQNNITFGAYTHGYQLLLEGVDGKYYPVTEGGSTGNTNTVSTAQIRVGGNILYYDTSTDQAANSSQGDYDLYQGYYTGNMEYWNNVDAGWATPYAPVYLVGTIETGNYFKLDNSSYTSFLTQNLPSTDDGKVYWYIGIMNNNYDAFRLDLNHPMYHYKDGAVRIYVPEHTHSIANVSGLQTALDSKQAAGSYAASSHTHTIANVTGLQTALDGKQASGSYLTTSGKAADSNLLDGLDLHTGRNNEVNKVVRTDSSGYIQAGWINTTSGATTSTLTKIYASQDDYIRYVTPTEFRRQITDGVYAPVSHSHAYSSLTGVPSTFPPSTHTLSSHTNDANYNIFNGWLRENGDNETFRVYGNTRMVVFRTDGTAGDTGHTGYAFKWTYGGDATGNTRMLLDNGGGIWTPRYGWLDERFQAASSAINTGNIGSQSVNYATSSDSANHAGKIRSNTFWGGVTNFNNFREQARIKYWEILGANKTSTAYPATPDQAAVSAGANNYGGLFTASGDYAHFEMYFPNNTGNIVHPEFTPYFRTGYQGSWSDWSRFVTSTGETTTILNGTTCILKTEGTAQWGSPSTAVVEIKAQSDNWAIKSYRWLTKAPNFNGSAFRLERYSQDAGWNLLGEVPINSTNWEWQGEIMWGMSDSRVKTNIVTMEDGLSTINKVRPVTFDWSPVEGVSDREGADFGFIAQELEEVIPGAVHTRTDGYKTVRYEKVVPVLVQAIKEQQSLIDSLVARIEALENK